MTVFLLRVSEPDLLKWSLLPFCLFLSLVPLPGPRATAVPHLNFLSSTIFYDSTFRALSSVFWSSRVRGSSPSSLEVPPSTRLSLSLSALRDSLRLSDPHPLLLYSFPSAKVSQGRGRLPTKVKLLSVSLLHLPSPSSVSPIV